MTLELRRALGSVWADPTVAALYRYRPDYPEAVIDVLRRVLVRPRTVLDAGSGTGALARRMAAFAARVDAVDPSAAMIDEARRLPFGSSESIRWIVAPAETAPLDPPYGLITTGQSLHWMDHDIVMPRFHDALAPGARLVVANIEWDYPKPWADDFVAIIKRYSPGRGWSPDLFEDLQRRGLFERDGARRTTMKTFDASIDDFVRVLQSTSSLSRPTLGDRSDAFAADVRALFARHELPRAHFGVYATLVWGRPLRP